MVEVKNLSKMYATVAALKHVSFSVQKGEILGFLGTNGAGKTTTMKIITGYTAPTEGEVFVNGLSIDESPLEIKRHIGYLPESVPLYEDMTVFEYLSFVADIRLKGLKQSKKGSEIFQSQSDALRRVISICGLQKVIRRLIGELSKGYRQRT